MSGYEEGMGTGYFPEEPAEEPHCDTCQMRGWGWRNGQRYRKCLLHSLPCDDLGNRCGKWEKLRQYPK